ncbi:translocation/assembly module TamB domain-containing protein [Algoriphagus marinus]|uniref:translocation/assembly module TamB domain-containing protein n=1 Tax=Algoriphagus marinus TaxID=1925762 RepID=UPI000A862B52|nr:translocation/assembly module TamB domain-containing protein [Algoriphagus marinus]
MHKAFRVIAWTIFSLVMLLISIALCLQLTSVQNWAIDRLTNFLNNNSEFHTEIGRIKLNWWDSIELKGVEITDHRDSTMISADAIIADFQITTLLPPGFPSLDYVRIEAAKIHLLTHSGDSSMNINRWIDELNNRFGGGAAGGGTRFEIGGVELRRSEFFLVDYNTEPITDGLDYNRLRFKEITANAQNFRINGDEIGIDIKILTGIESSSDFQIQELKTNFVYASEFMEFDQLSLKTKNSYLKDYLRFQYASPASLSNFIDDVVIIANLEESKLDLRDLKLFAPSLPNINDEIFLSGKITGPISDIKSNEFLIRFGAKTAIFGTFELDGLPDIKNTYINLSLKNSTILARDLAPYLPADIEKEINKFNNIRITADFIGYLNRFTTNGEFKTSIGDISGRINYDLINELPSIVSKISVDNLDLGIISENRDLLQKISLSGNVNANGNTLENLLLDIDAQISQIGIKNYNYTGINTDATYGLDLFKGNLSIADPNLKLTATGEANLKGANDSIRLNLNIDTALVSNLNLSSKLNFISGNLNIDSRGIKIDDIQGIAKVQNLKIGYEDRFLDIGDFFFQSLFAGGTRTLSLNSDYIVAAASGQFNLEQMGSDLQILFDQYASIILNEEQPIADLEKNFSETYNLDLNLKLIDMNPIIQLFQPDWSLSKNTILEGAFYQTPENTIFNLFTSIDTLSYQGKTAFATNIDFNTSKLINSEDILASFYVFSKKQQLTNTLEFTDLGFEGIWNENQMELDFSLDQDSTQSAARINATAQFSTENTKLTFAPSSLKVLNQVWQFDSENLITVVPGKLTFENVKVLSEDQFIAIEGKIGESPDDQLNLSIHNVNIDLLNTLLPQDFGGQANGIMTFEQLYADPLISGNLTLDDFSINKFPIGNLEADLNMGPEEILISLTNTLNGAKSIDIDGSIGLAEQDLDMNARLTEANLVIFEPFLSNYISELGGTVTGNIKIGGTTAIPELDGRGRISDGLVKVNYLNTSYTLNGSILFKPTQISLQEVSLRDEFNNIATLQGGLNHKGFRNIVLDISSRLTDFHILNTTEKNSDTFYGSAFVTGTVDVKGTTSNLDINANAVSKPNTRIYIPLGSSSSQSQEDFINLINIQDTVRIQKIAEDINRLDIENIRMNFVLDINPDAYAEIIIDPKTGEGISGRGSGVLTMNIDTQGNFSLTGTYEISEGEYNFSLYNVVKKKFTIRPGGRITWYGDPYQGIMNLTAEYTENVSIQPLLASSSVTDNETTSSRRYPVDVIMNLNGELLSPDITFGFDFSEFPPSGDVQTTISAFQNRIANDEQEMNRQVFSVIMTRGFSPEGQFSGTSTITSSLGQLLSSQLNNFLGQVDKNLEVNFDLASLDQSTLETFQLSVAYTFLDGRLRVSRDGGFTDNRGNAQAASIIGDWQAEYLLTEDGVYRIRIFNRNNFNTFTSLSLSKNVATYGVSLSQNISFNSFSELFKKITQGKQERLRINDTDDFLRYNYENGEKWNPIDLEPIENRMDSLNRIPPPPIAKPDSLSRKKNLKQF